MLGTATKMAPQSHSEERAPQLLVQWNAGSGWWSSLRALLASYKPPTLRNFDLLPRFQRITLAASRKFPDGFLSDALCASFARSVPAPGAAGPSSGIQFVSRIARKNLLSRAPARCFANIAAHRASRPRRASRHRLKAESTPRFRQHGCSQQFDRCFKARRPRQHTTDDLPALLATGSANSGRGEIAEYGAGQSARSPQSAVAIRSQLGKAHSSQSAACARGGSISHFRSSENASRNLPRPLGLAAPLGDSSCRSGEADVEDRQRRPIGSRKRRSCCAG